MFVTFLVLLYFDRLTDISINRASPSHGRRLPELFQIFKLFKSVTKVNWSYIHFKSVNVHSIAIRVGTMVCPVSSEILQILKQTPFQKSILL